MTGARILVVEDDAAVAQSLAAKLAGLGYAVPITVFSAEEAVQAAIETQPDLVMVDAHLEGAVTGVQAAAEIRARLDIPVICLAGDANDETLQRAKLSEPSGYVVAPFDAKTLRATIEISLHKHRSEQALWQRARELELLNRIELVFNSTLDPDQVLVNVLEEARRLLNVDACSVWLVEPAGQVVCRQATGPYSDVVRGWRLALGEGLVGWVALHGESVIVPDMESDDRHFAGVDQETGLTLRSLLSTPLKAKQNVVGVIQVMDAEADRFREADLALVEPFASAAAIAIENARLYRETDRLRAFNESIVQGIQEGILIEDAHGCITFANPKAADLLGYPTTELIGQHWSAIVAPEHVDQVRAESSRRSQGVSSRYEATLLTREGIRIPVIISALPLFEDERFTGVLSAFIDISARVRAEKERERLIAELRDALAKVKTLSGMLPICSSCKKIRDDQGYWHRVEEFIHEHSEADFSHGLCPECAKRLYPDYFGEEDEPAN